MRAASRSETTLSLSQESEPDGRERSRTPVAAPKTLMEKQSMLKVLKTQLARLTSLLKTADKLLDHKHFSDPGDKHRPNLEGPLGRPLSGAAWVPLDVGLVCDWFVTGL